MNALDVSENGGKFKRQLTQQELANDREKSLNTDLSIFLSYYILTKKIRTRNAKTMQNFPLNWCRNDWWNI